MNALRILVSALQSQLLYLLMNNVLNDCRAVYLLYISSQTPDQFTREAPATSLLGASNPDSACL